MPTYFGDEDSWLSSPKRDTAVIRASNDAETEGTSGLYKRYLLKETKIILKTYFYAIMISSINRQEKKLPEIT